MPHQDTQSHPCLPSALAPRTPTEVHCAPNAAAPPSDDSASTGGRECTTSPVANARPPRPAGRSNEAIMRAFREQRRVTAEEGEAGAVIVQILAKVGSGSLAADLNHPE